MVDWLQKVLQQIRFCAVIPLLIAWRQKKNAFPSYFYCMIAKNPDSSGVLEYFGTFLDLITAATMYGYWPVQHVYLCLFIASEQCLLAS